MVKNSPSNAGDAGSIPGQGTEMPQPTCRAATKPTHCSQRSLRATARELVCQDY